MTYAVKENETAARERLQAFWAGTAIDRPALHVVVKNPEFVEQPWPGKVDESLPLAQRELTAEKHAWDIRHGSRRWLYLAESMPGHHVPWGSFLTTLAVLAGGEYEYHESAWIKEIPDILNRPPPRFDPAHPVARRLDACYAAAKEAIGTDGFITPPLMMDGLTTLAMFRGADRLCMDLVDRPDWAKAWTGALNTMYIDIYERYYRSLGYSESICFFGPLAEGRSEGVQCDFAVNLSPAMYEEFVLPDMLRVTNYMDRSLYHLDGTCQMRFIDLLRQCPKLSGIQWNPESTAGSPLKWIDALREIRRRRFCLMIWAPSVEEAVELAKALGPEGLYLIPPASETVAEAEETIRRIQAVC